MKISGYHAHIYFDSSLRESAEKLRLDLMDVHADKTRVSRLINEAIGPHPLPMFEADFNTGDFESVVSWLMLHHGAHSILVHPITGNDLMDHRDHPIWIGKQLPLNLSIF